MKYSDQLKTNEWKDFRENILLQYKHTCICCGANKNLEVHHLSYHNDKYAWEYNINDVVVLCRSCHENTHKRLKLINIGLSNSKLCKKESDLLAKIMYNVLKIDAKYYQSLDVFVNEIIRIQKESLRNK
jgi:hypothetical protein